MSLQITPHYYCNWFAYNICCKLGNGKLIGFWKFKWLGNETLSSIFPLIYHIAANLDAKITDEGI